MTASLLMIGDPPEPLPEIRPPLTKRQLETLRVVYDFFMAHRYYPTQKEVCSALGVASTNARNWIEPLVRKGYVAKESTGRRNLRLTDAGLERLRTTSVPPTPRLVN